MKELSNLIAALSWLQAWVKPLARRVSIGFESRAAAGRCGAIASFTGRVNSNAFRVVAQFLLPLAISTTNHPPILANRE